MFLYSKDKDETKPLPQVGQRIKPSYAFCIDKKKSVHSAKFRRDAMHWEGWHQMSGWTCYLVDLLRSYHNFKKKKTKFCIFQACIGVCVNTSVSIAVEAEFGHWYQNSQKVKMQNKMQKKNARTCQSIRWKIFLVIKKKKKLETPASLVFVIVMGHLFSAANRLLG